VPIDFIPNDPLTQGLLPPRRQSPRPDPPSSQARFSYASAPQEAPFPFGSSEFLFWQCREAALAGLEVWTAISAPLAQWQDGSRLLPLQPLAGTALNARYDRTGLSFFEWDTGGKQTFSGASTDAVAHELGHAILDSLRPDLWDSFYTETAAFHEAFADCLALLVGLFDRPTRQALLAGPGLRSPNFLSELAEDVADGVRREEGGQHPHALPRRALNTFQWRIPIDLAASGPPELLTSEPHSFSRIFTGCFYDAICNVFDVQPRQDEQGLLAAAQVVGRLLAAAVPGAPEMARFFQAVGRAMVLADEAAHGGSHHLAIRDAFAAHNVALGSSAMLAPTSGLAAPAPRIDAQAGTARLAASGRRRLRRRLGAARRSRLDLSVAALGGELVAKAVHRRDVSLGSLAPRLKGVVAAARESVLVGASETRAVVLGLMQDREVTIDEVRHFVGTLLEHDTVQRKQAPESPFAATHAVRSRGGRKRITRVCFACAPWSAVGRGRWGSCVPALRDPGASGRGGAAADAGEVRGGRQEGQPQAGRRRDGRDGAQPEPEGRASDGDAERLADGGRGGGEQRRQQCHRPQPHAIGHHRIGEAERLPAREHAVLAPALEIRPGVVRDGDPRRADPRTALVAGVVEPARRQALRGEAGDQRRAHDRRQRSGPGSRPEHAPVEERQAADAGDRAERACHDERRAQRIREPGRLPSDGDERAPEAADQQQAQPDQELGCPAGAAPEREEPSPDDPARQHRGQSGEQGERLHGTRSAYRAAASEA
jgi:hypothetical protein